MSSTHLDPDLVYPFFKVAKSTSYVYVAAITVVVYDAILLYHKEVKHIYSGPWSIIKVIYVLIRALAAVDFILFLYTTQQTFVSTAATTWITGFSRHIAYTCLIKTVLVMRLRALYGNHNTKVTVLLGIAMAVELTTAGFQFFLVCITTQIYGTLMVPFPGCIVAFPKNMYYLNKYSETALWTSKLFSNTVEVTLTVRKLYRSLTQVTGNFLSSLERMRYWRPILYVFYRDGTLFFIPMFAISLLALLDSLLVIQSTTSWTLWLSLVYCTCGARLILNLRMANCRFNESTVDNQISTLQIHTDYSTRQNYSDTKSTF